MHFPSLSMVVIERHVPSAAIVPHCYRSIPPVKAMKMLRLCGVTIQSLQKRLRFFHRHTFEMQRESRIDIQNFLTALWMPKHNRMNRILCRRIWIPHSTLQTGRENVPARMNSVLAFDQVF